MGPARRSRRVLVAPPAPQWLPRVHYFMALWRCLSVHGENIRIINRDMDEWTVNGKWHLLKYSLMNWTPGATPFNGQHRIVIRSRSRVHHRTSAVRFSLVLLSPNSPLKIQKNSTSGHSSQWAKYGHLAFVSISYLLEQAEPRYRKLERSHPWLDQWANNCFYGRHGIRLNSNRKRAFTGRNNCTAFLFGSWKLYPTGPILIALFKERRYAVFTFFSGPDNNKDIK